MSRENAPKLYFSDEKFVGKSFSELKTLDVIDIDSLTVQSYMNQNP